MLMLHPTVTSKTSPFAKKSKTSQWTCVITAYFLTSCADR